MSGRVGLRPATLWVAAAVIFAASVAVRIPVLLERPLAGYLDNEDATAHVLATMVAYSEVDWRIHGFLPILTLGADHDKWIAEMPSASRFDGHGNAFYTSWPPGLFIFPYAVSRALGIPPSPAFLRGLNLTLQLIGCTLAAVLCATIAGPTAATSETRRIAAATGFVVNAASPEGLYSHLFAYWGQALYGPILLMLTILFLRRRTGWAFFGLAAIGGFLRRQCGLRRCLPLCPHCRAAAERLVEGHRTVAGDRGCHGVASGVVQQPRSARRARRRSAATGGRADVQSRCAAGTLRRLRDVARGIRARPRIRDLARRRC